MVLEDLRYDIRLFSWTTIGLLLLLARSLTSLLVVLLLIQVNPYRKRRQLNNRHGRVEWRIWQHLLVLVQDLVQIGELRNPIADYETHDDIEQEPHEPVATAREWTRFLFDLPRERFDEHGKVNDVEDINQLVR